MTSNDCGDQAALPPQVSVSVSSATADGYDLLLELIDQNISFSCSLDGSSFSCSAETSEDYADWGWAVVLDHTHDMTGTWLTESSFEGSLSSTSECVGSECDGFGEVIGSTLPCTVVHELDGGQ